MSRWQLLSLPSYKRFYLKRDFTFFVVKLHILYFERWKSHGGINIGGLFARENQSFLDQQEHSDHWTLCSCWLKNSNFQTLSGYSFINVEWVNMTGHDEQKKIRTWTLSLIIDVSYWKSDLKLVMYFSWL